MALVKKNRRKTGYFNSYILQRIERNKNFIACITGQTGSGKSWSALREGETLDLDFDIRNVCFTPQEFMALVNEKTKKLKRGSVIIYDEVQVTMSHLDYQSIQAKMINYVLQTFRHRGFILFMTSPHFSFINASARKLFHSRMETLKIDKNKKQVTLKPFLLQVNQDTGDVYRKYLRIATKEKGVVPLKSLKVGIPSKELIKAYEEKKTAFTTQLNENIAKDLKRLEKGEDNKPLTEKQRQIIEDLINKKTIEDIHNERGIAYNGIYQHIELAKRKGIEIKPIKDKNKVLYYKVEGYEAL